MRKPWSIKEGKGPLIAAAVHAGHEIRPDVARYIGLSESQRLREEDPFTDRWTRLAATRIVVHRSRFEFDLNRPRPLAIYRRPEQAWGLEVWREALPEELAEQSLALYDQFYDQVNQLLERKVQQFGGFVLLDLHSYNHRREGADGPFAPPETNPDMNVGTGSMPREYWAALVDAWIAEVQADGRLQVGENVRFLGGQFPRWVHERFPQRGCALAIEIKKIFMDEWTGEFDPAALDRVGEVLARAARAVEKVLKQSWISAPAR